MATKVVTVNKPLTPFPIGTSDFSVPQSGRRHSVIGRCEPGNSQGENVLHCFIEEGMTENRFLAPDQENNEATDGVGGDKAVDRKVRGGRNPAARLYSLRRTIVVEAAA